jgi:acetyl-CoA C-acetyltransferase
MASPVIVAARRTAVATVGRGFAGVGVEHLLAPLIAEQAAVLPRVDDVVVGMARSAGGDPARVAALEAGVDVPGVTVDRQCGSGLAAVALAASMVRAGDAAYVIAGGAESASTAPAGRARFAPDSIGDPDMGPAAEQLATDRGITRDRQDAYAARSHERAVAADVAAEILAINGVQRDDRPRRLDARLLARMPAAFSAAGTVTAGNSCGVSDGAATVTVVDDAWHRGSGLPGMRIRSHATTSCDPRTPGIGPVDAIRAVCDRGGVDLADVDVIEITEAFAAQVLAVTDALGLDALGRDAHRICPLGGAIAMGHPWGASGAILVVRLFTHLVRHGTARFGVAACAVGGGQGVAMLVERA